MDSAGTTKRAYPLERLVFDTRQLFNWWAGLWRRTNCSSARENQRLRCHYLVLSRYIKRRVKVSGDFKFLEATGGGFSKGFKLERADNSLSSTVINTETPANVFAPRVNGALEVTQNFGSAVAMDVLVFGIRPATVKSTLIGAKATGTLNGDMTTAGRPSQRSFAGNGCFSLNKQVFSDCR